MLYPVHHFEQSCLVMDPSQRLSCEELLELPYFQEEGGVNWGREGERIGRRHEKGSRRRQPGVSRILNIDYTVTSKPEFTLDGLRRCARRDHCCCCFLINKVVSLLVSCL